jgi:putative RNA 2'-phosphotransferase
LVSLSKVMSHALRHRPWLYELELDGGGWVPVADLVSALRGQGGRWANLTPVFQ